MDISRSTDRERWQIKKRKISEKQNIKKKVYDQARGRTRINIGAAFQRWRELKEREDLEADAEVALFLLDIRSFLTASTPSGKLSTGHEHDCWDLLMFRHKSARH
uniref:Uncharacterized protein n=1 Tax=Sinocyclocheilus anshuiensis TaxID=1608454 RepID=A0A671QV73_9TELE